MVNSILSSKFNFSKGQLILKGLFDILDLVQKTNETIQS